MTNYIDISDDELLRLLREALAARDAVPAHVVAMAKAALDLAGTGLDALDWELARLVADSARELVGVRGDGGDRQLDFEGEEADLVVLLTDPSAGAGPGAGAELTGQLVPATGTLVEVVQAGAVVRSARSDELGRFRVRDLPPGPLRLRVPGVRLVTPAFEA